MRGDGKGSLRPRTLNRSSLHPKTDGERLGLRIYGPGPVDTSVCDVRDTQAASSTTLPLESDGGWGISHWPEKERGLVLYIAS